jgi:hypothetical protein
MYWLTLALIVAQCPLLLETITLSPSDTPMLWAAESCIHSSFSGIWEKSLRLLIV